VRDRTASGPVFADAVLASGALPMPVFTDQRNLLARFVQPLAGPVAARYGLSCAGLDGVAHLEIDLVAPDDAALVWDNLPSPSSAAFLAPGACIALAIQTAMRAWLPYVWFTQPERFEDFDQAAVLIMYSACRPFTPRSKEAFVFDILDEDTPRAMHYSISRNLRPRLEGFEDALNAAGVSNARRYATRRWDRMLELFPKRRHEMNSILVAERELVEGYLDLANPPKRQRGRVRIERVLRKLFLKRDFSGLAGLFEWEALRAANRSAGIALAFDAKILANSQPLPPLIAHEDNSAGTDSDCGIAA
jgi:hypothetical protein